MKVLLIGGMGFIGRHIIERLHSSQELIILCTVADESDHASYIKDYGLKVEIGDVTDKAAVDSAILRHKPECAVHLAALTGVKRCNENPSLAFQVNVYGTYNVVMGCLKFNSKLVFISSREVYGESLSGQTKEDDPLVPNNVYGLTKLLSERLIRWASDKYGLNYTILRLTNVYGPGGDQYNIQAIILKAFKERRIQILGGSQKMNLVFVDDVVEVIRRCLTDPRSSKQVYNVGSQDNFSIEEIVSRIIPSLGFTPAIEHLLMRSGETLSFKPNLEKLAKMLDYYPPTRFNEALQKTVEWYRVKLKSDDRDLKGGNDLDRIS